MTIDIVSLPNNSERECGFLELPPPIQDKVKLHSGENEEIPHCLVVRKDYTADPTEGDFLVQVITIHRII